MSSPPNIKSVIAYARESWRNDGAEGETVHALCDALEAPRVTQPKQKLATALRADGRCRHCLGPMVRFLDDYSGCKSRPVQDDGTWPRCEPDPPRVTPPTCRECGKTMYPVAHGTDWGCSCELDTPTDPEASDE